MYGIHHDKYGFKPSEESCFRQQCWTRRWSSFGIYLSFLKKRRLTSAIQYYTKFKHNIYYTYGCIDFLAFSTMRQTTIQYTIIQRTNI